MSAPLTPFFSVVVPVYNRARLVTLAIRSVLGQTEQDFEIVVIDDGSTDRLKKAVDAFADDRIRYVRKPNGGAGSARNLGIDIARGRFIAFLDSDDIFLPHHLAQMRKLVENREDIAGYAPLIVDRGGGRTFSKPPRAIAPGEHMASYLLNDRGFVPTTTLVLSKPLAARIRYDESLPFAQDVDIALRLFLAGCRFVMADAPGAIWRDFRDPDRVSASRKGASLKDWLEALKPLIPERAYHGARGWVIAKGIARKNPGQALRLYLAAVARGCYRPRLAMTVFLQIFLPDGLYRRLADGVIVFLRGAVWSRAERQGAWAKE